RLAGLQSESFAVRSDARRIAIRFFSERNRDVLRRLSPGQSEARQSHREPRRPLRSQLAPVDEFVDAAARRLRILLSDVANGRARVVQPRDVYAGVREHSSQLIGSCGEARATCSEGVA